MMPQVQWDGWKINLGHVLAILIPTFGIAAAWGAAETRSAAHQMEISRLQERVAELESRERTASVKLTDNERETVRALTRLETQISAIQATLGRLERNPQSFPLQR